MGIIRTFPEEYHFMLRGHRFVPESENTDFRFISGSMMGVKIKRESFRAVQVKVVRDGPRKFAGRSHIFSFSGFPEPALFQNKALLWHMITKFK